MLIHLMRCKSTKILRNIRFSQDAALAHVLNGAVRAGGADARRPKSMMDFRSNEADRIA
jgi:hypothetical protein